MSSTFDYQAFRVDPSRRLVTFDYHLTEGGQSYQLSETLTFPVPLQDSVRQNASLAALHLALGVSYYKIFVSERITHPYRMSNEDARFWNGIWQHGLGEFLYVNKLEPSRLAQFATQDGIAYTPEPPSMALSQTALLGIGGGKDSIVAGELLKKLGVSVEGFVMATGKQLGQAKAVTDTMGVPLHVVERRLDPQLLALQTMPGGYQGHVPISLIFGLVGTALAVALDTPYVVVANESSASIPRISWEHGAVNHQWSKSFGFERQLQAYLHEHVSPETTYFSAIRQLTSAGVAKAFVQYPQYFEVFTSDNSVFRIDPAKRPNVRWSLESPKSLSSFMLLAPWLPESELLRIFGLNLLDEQSLWPLFASLTGYEGEPPLDCVGTVEELAVSVNVMAQQEKFHDSYLVREAREKHIIHNDDWQAKLAALLEMQPEQALPDALRNKITDELKRELTA